MFFLVGTPKRVTWEILPSDPAISRIPELREVLGHPARTQFSMSPYLRDGSFLIAKKQCVLTVAVKRDCGYRSKAIEMS